MTASLFEISVDLIDPNPYQPRTFFPEAPQRELKSSIESNGLLQPIILRGNGERYQIIAGERRFRAVRDLGFPTIASLVQEHNEEEMRVLSILENIQREDLSIIEQARSYRALIDETNLTQEEAAKRLGKDRSTIANAMRLLTLPIEIQDDITQTRLTGGHARALLPLSDKNAILSIRDSIVKKKLNVRATEKLVRKILSRTTDTPPVIHDSEKSADITQLEEQLSLHLETNVEIWGTEEGSLQIQFGSVADFNRIFNLILEKENDES